MNEIELSCFLKSRSNIRKFAMLILWKLIKDLLKYFNDTQKRPVSRKIGSRKVKSRKISYNLSKASKSYITELLVEKYQNVNQLVKPGISLNMAEKVIRYVNNNNKEEYNNILEGEKNFHKVMGCIYGFLDGRIHKKGAEVIFYIVENNQKLRNYVLGRIKELFFLPDVDWETVKSYIGDDKKMISDMIFSVVKFPVSSFRRNLSRVPYIRSCNTNLDLSNCPKELLDQILINVKKDKKNCHRDFTSNKDALLLSAKYYYNLEGTFFKNIMKHYNNPIIGGPSGSIVILHDIAFKLLQIENTKENQLLLLGIGIADYVPYYHTLDEILMAYMNEINIKYTIDKDPVKFTMKLFKKYNIV